MYALEVIVAQNKVGDSREKTTPYGQEKEELVDALEGLLTYFAEYESDYDVEIPEISRAREILEKTRQ